MEFNPDFKVLHHYQVEQPSLHARDQHQDGHRQLCCEGARSGGSAALYHGVQGET